MSAAFGPLTHTYGLNVSTVPDGSGGLTLSCQLLGTIAVSATQLLDTTTQQLVDRICAAEDVPTNWLNLQAYLS